MYISDHIISSITEVHHTITYHIYLHINSLTPILYFTGSFIHIPYHYPLTTHSDPSANSTLQNALFSSLDWGTWYETSGARGGEESGGEL